jgi:hypothetical protein
VEAEKLYWLWGLLLLLVPLAAAELHRGWTRVDRIFGGLCVAAEFALLAFAPRFTVDAVAAAITTLAVSAAVLGVYLAASPRDRAHALVLAAIVAVIDVAALAAIDVGETLALGRALSALLLLLGAGLPILAAHLVLKRRPASVRTG